MMNTLAPAKWQPLRSTMCERLNRKKNDRTIEILSSTYAGEDVIFLQEVAQAFVAKALASPLAAQFEILVPADADPDRDQNSLVLLKKGSFADIVEVTPAVLGAADAGAPIARGDLYCAHATEAARGADGEPTPFLLCSFHGDTNGLATLPAAWAMISQRPAEILRLPDRGRLAPGLRADMVVVDPVSRAVEATICGGRITHMSGEVAERFFAATQGLAYAAE